jgi:hypothetical protein
MLECKPLGSIPHDLFVWEMAMNKLREIQVIRRVTQFQLRLLSGIHQSRISLIENGGAKLQVKGNINSRS